MSVEIEEPNMLNASQQAQLEALVQGMGSGLYVVSAELL